MPSPLVISHIDKVLDVRRVVEGTANHGGQDGFEFCIGKPTPIGENTREHRFKVTDMEAIEIARYINRGLMPSGLGAMPSKESLGG